MGGLSQSTRRWYEEQIMAVLKKYGRVSLATIVDELHSKGQNRYPIQEERICAFLKYLRACKKVRYHKSEQRKIASKWEAEK